MVKFRLPQRQWTARRRVYYRCGNHEGVRGPHGIGACGGARFVCHIGAIPKIFIKFK